MSIEKTKNNKIKRLKVLKKKANLFLNFNDKNIIIIIPDINTTAKTIIGQSIETFVGSGVISLLLSIIEGIIFVDSSFCFDSSNILIFSILFE